MNCREFDAWLDEGRPQGGAAAPARAHAGGCARCAAELAAALEIEALLEPAERRAPVNFTDRLMARIQREASSPRPAAALLPSAMPWWVRAAADPACIAAAVLAGVLAWRGHAAVSGARSLLEMAAGRIAAIELGAATAGRAGSVSPVMALGAAVALATFVALASWPLYSWMVREAISAAAPFRRRNS